MKNEQKSRIMKIREKYKGMDGARIWEVIVHHVIANKRITTLTGISFTATFVGSCIFLKGGTPGTKKSREGGIPYGKGFHHSLRHHKRLG